MRLHKSLLALTLLLTTMLSTFQLRAEIKIMLVGDSLSAGYGLKQEESWFKLLQDKWQKSKPDTILINASISGETTTGGLARLPKLLNEHQPDIVIIELGGNDGLRGYPVKKIRSNLNQMIEKTRESGAIPWLMEIHIPPNYGRRYTSMFTGNYSSLSEEHDIHLIPFFLKDIATQPDLMQRDGIHPNKQAQAQIVEIMDKSLQHALQSTVTE